MQDEVVRTKHPSESLTGVGCLEKKIIGEISSEWIPVTKQAIYVGVLSENECLVQWALDFQWEWERTHFEDKIFF